MKTKALISIHVPTSVKEDLATRAAAEEIDLSKLCRRILKQHIAANPLAPVEVPDRTAAPVLPSAPAADHPKAA